MTQPKNFKDFGITIDKKAFRGDKIGVERILNKEIQVVDYKIGPSKYPEKGNGKCLTFQIIHNQIDYIVFSGSGVLMAQIEKIPREHFPFKTTIERKDDKSLEFT